MPPSHARRLRRLAVALLLLAAVGAPAAAAEAPGSTASPDRPILLERAYGTAGLDEATGRRSLGLLDVDGGIRRVTRADVSAARWSPDGTRIAFATPVPSLGVVAPDGSGERILATPADTTFVELPAQPWSPDGTRLLAVERGEAIRLVAVDVATGERRLLAGAEGLYIFPGAAWSPDGATVAFASTQGVHTVPAAGGPPTLVAEGPADAVGWHRGGAALLVSSFDDVASVDVATGQRTVVLAGPRDVHAPDLSASVRVNDRVLEVYDPEGHLVRLIETGAPVLDVAWTEAGLFAASGDPDGCVIGRADVVREGFHPLSGTCAGGLQVAPAATAAPLPAATARSLWWSRQRPAGSAATVLLGRADDFADSLASGGLQGAVGAPLLLMDPAALHPAVRDELDRLGAREVVLLGGPAAVGQDVEAALRASGRTTRRVQGATRLATAVAAAREVEAATGPPTTVVLVRAFGDPEDPTRGFADSLAAGALAADLAVPVLLTATDGLSEEVGAYLDATRSVARAVVVGGPAAVGDAVTGALAGRGLEVVRLSGPTRTTTAAAVRTWARGRAAADDGQRPAGAVVVDAGDALGWADGFAAAGLADPARGGGVLLVGVSDLDEDAIASAAETPASDVGEPDPVVTCGPLVAIHRCQRVTGALLASARPDTDLVAVESDPAVTVRARVAIRDAGCLTATTEGVALVDVHLGVPGDYLLGPYPAAGGRVAICDLPSIFHGQERPSAIATAAEAEGALVVFRLADGTERHVPLAPA
jgi:putative cell wall-binding protein